MKEEFKWFLRDEVVNPGLCTYCGACAAVCPNDRIEFLEDGPALTEECPRDGMGACMNVCHRITTDASRMGLTIFGFKAKPPSLIGQYEKMVSARAVDSAIREAGQDGGAVTALLAYCLESGLVDGVVATKGMWKPTPSVITDKAGLLEAAGSRYSVAPILTAVEEAGKTLNKIAVVALPCQVNGLRRMQFFEGLNAHPLEVSEEDGMPVKLPAFVYTIGLYCMQNFSYERLKDFLTAKGVDLGKVKKFTIRQETMRLEMEDGSVEIDLGEFEDAGVVWDGCSVCRDAVSKLADVSAGYTGTPKDWTTLIARNAKGLELIEGAENAGYIETSSEVEVDRIEEFADRKMRKFDRELKKRLSEEKPIKFYWASDYPGVRREAKGTFFVKIRTSSGLVNHDYLAKVAELAGKYGDGSLEFTTRQTIEIQGVNGEKIDDLMAELYEKGLMTIGMGYVVACPGMAYCPEGLVETKQLANELTAEFVQRLTPHKMKIGVAGCPNSCVRVRRHDIGIMGHVRPVLDLETCNGCGRCTETCKPGALSVVAGKAQIDRDTCIECGWCIRSCPHEAMIEEAKGYSLWIGGNDARIPTDGILLKNFCTKEDLFRLINSVAAVFLKYRTKPGRERLGNVIRRVGEGEFLREVFETEEKIRSK